VKFLAISGYGHTGHTAFLDLIREFEGFNIPSSKYHFEFRLLKDPNGIFDLENNLVNNWDIIRSSRAIEDFIEFCSLLYRKNRYFKMGINYHDVLDKDFFKYTLEYINEITLCNYEGNSLTKKYKLNSYELFFDKLKYKLFNSVSISNMYISQPNYDFFLNSTRNYLEKIFSKYSDSFNNIVVLDNAIPVSNIKNGLKYFNSIKMVIVDRDIRDVYVELKRKKLMIGNEIYLNDDVEKYIYWAKTLRKQNEYIDDRLLRIQFEDLILDYHNVLQQIIQFLGDDMEHQEQFKFFDPSKSIKNIGIWKDYPNQEIMLKILTELPEYCYTKYD
jgi:hypothetical protein